MILPSDIDSDPFRNPLPIIFNFKKKSFIKGKFIQTQWPLKISHQEKKKLRNDVHKVGLLATCLPGPKHSQRREGSTSCAMLLWF